MTPRSQMLRSFAPLAVILAALALVTIGEVRVPAAAEPADKSPSAAQDPDLPAADTPAYATETLEGRVVWLEDALARQLGVTTEPTAAGTSVVLETPDGRLMPIIPDVRGRAFAVDERLRNQNMRLLVRRYLKAPMIQVIRVFVPKDDGLYELDYWCDICAIPMYIQKACECCQGPNRLRLEKVEDGAAGG
jgi:hypothetical protein